MQAFSLVAFSVCIIAAAQVPASTQKASPVSLLDGSTASLSTASTNSRSKLPEVLQSHFDSRNRNAVNPKPEGHMLTDHELRPIQNVACLEAKQIDPTVNCSDAYEQAGPSLTTSLNAGNYPTWRDARCNSNGEYFCDPDRLLTGKERATITAHMKELREQGQQVTCGPQLQHDPIDKWHYQPFYLGVAIAKDWPQHESDAQSLQTFGRMLAGRWNMTYTWNGNPEFYARCPNEAVLIILPEKHQAILSSPSCMFICEEKGGPEVGAATLLSLDAHGLSAGVTAGVSQVYKAIAESSPMHKPGWDPKEKTSGTWSTWGTVGQVDPGQARSSIPADLEQNIWNWGQRVLFGFAVLLLVGSLITALLVCYLAPGLAKELNKRPGETVDAYYGLLKKGVQYNSV